MRNAQRQTDGRFFISRSLVNRQIRRFTGNKYPKVRGSLGSTDARPLNISDSGACLTCLFWQGTDGIDTLNNFEQNQAHFCMFVCVCV